MNTAPKAPAASPAAPSWSALSAVALLALGACGETKPAGSPSAPLGAGGAIDSPQSQTEDPRDARPTLLSTKVEILASAGATLESSLLARSPLLDAKVRVKPGVGAASPSHGQPGRAGSSNTTFEATLRYQVPLDTVTGSARLSFSVPANLYGSADGRGRTLPPVRLERVEVHGATTSADGTSWRWEVPVDAKAGLADVTLHVVGELPGFEDRRTKRALEKELDALPALAQLLPEVPQLDPAEVYGATDSLLIIAGALPALAQTPPAVFRLEVEVEDAADGWTTLATGREVPTSNAPRRFVGLAHELAVVLARDLSVTREAVGGRELILAFQDRAAGTEPSHAPTPPVPKAQEDLLRLARRALESVEDRVGPLEGPSLTLLVTDALDELGAAALPGLVLLPRRHGPLAPQPQRPASRLADGDWLQRLDLLLAHHPGPREAYERAVATAIGRLPWGGWDSGPLGRLLEHGLGADTALRALRGSLGEKAQRRALELGWRLPYQLGRMRGADDPALIALEPAEDPNFALVARAKSGLAIEHLSRALGDEPWAALVAGLRAARKSGTPLTEALVHDLFARHAPRPELATSLWTRWTHERRGDTDVGELRPEVLLEYLVTDGAVTGLSHALMDNAGELAGSPLGQKALARLSAGDSLDAGFAVAMLGELLGPSLDPTSRRWLELGTGLFSKESRKSALEGLIDELGGELGIPAADRARLGQLGGLVLDALDAPGPPSEPAPGEPPPAE